MSEEFEELEAVFAEADEPVRKSDRATLFINAVGMTEEDLLCIYEDLENGGFTKKYRPIILNTPIQVFSEQQMESLIKEWSQDQEIGEEQQNRISDIRRHMYWNNQAWDNAKSQLAMLNENIEQIESAFTKLASSIEGQLSGRAVDTQGLPITLNIDLHPFNRLIASTRHRLSDVTDHIDVYTPKEGQKW